MSRRKECSEAPRNWRADIAAVAVLIATMWAAGSNAMEVKATLEEIAHTADLVVVGTVVDSSCRFNDAETMIFTDVTLDRVVRVYAGERSVQADASRVRITYAGGQVGERGVSVSGSPRLELGQRYLLFLLDDGRVYANPIVAGAQGQLRVVEDGTNDAQYLLTTSGKAVVGVAGSQLILSRGAVDGITEGVIAVRPQGDERPALESRIPMASDPASKASPGPPSAQLAEPERAMPLSRFIDALHELLAAPAPRERVLRFGPHEGRFFAAKDGVISSRPLPSQTPQVDADFAARWRAAASEDEAREGEAGPNPGDIDVRAPTGGTLGYCGYHDLSLTMQQLPESWWEWGVNNSGMWDWNQVMNIYTYIDSDGYYGDNDENEFCAYVNDANLASVYGYTWGSGIAMCITWWIWCECCEIVQSDILWNAAYWFTNDWEYSIGNNSVIYLATVNMHELGHSWGMQRGSYVETYDYDQPTVMQPYYHNVVETGRGVHRPEAYCIRRLYDDQTGILGTKDVGVESYWASNGLNNAYASPTTVHPGDTVTLYGVTVENISYAAVADLRVRFWLSTNRTITTSDTQLGGYWYWGSFAGEAYNVGNYSMAVPGIAAGQYYIGAIVTMNGFGSDDYTGNNTSSFLNKLTVLPAAPASVVATDGTYTDRIRVTWASVAGATGYQVYRRSCSSCTPYIVGSTTGTYFNDTASLAPRCTYYYYVKATSSYGSSYSSTQDSGWREFTTPSGFSATDNQANRVRLTWSSVYGATGYDIFRSGCDDPWCVYLKIGTVTGTLYDDTTALPGLDYFYFIRAFDGCGSSPNSAVNGGSIALPAPTGLTASDGTYVGKVSVSWNAVSYATSYDLWRGTSPSPTTLIGSPTGTTYDDYGASPGVTYYYFVVARSSIGAGVMSGYDSGYAADLIFADGFERGTLGNWSAAAP